MFDDMAPREEAVDLGFGPGPFALAAAAACDPASLTDEALLDLLAAVERSMSWAAAMRAALVAEHASRAPVEPRNELEDREQEWHREELAAATRTSPHEAGVRSDTAIALLDRLPMTFEALQNGSFPWAQAVALARQTRGLSPAESGVVERMVLGDPRAVSVGQVTAAAQRAVELVRPPLAEAEDARAYDLRSLVFWPHDDGTTDLHARLTTDAAALVAAALEPLAAPADAAAADDRSVEQRRADALVELATGGAPGQSRPDVRVQLLGRRDSARGLADGLLDTWFGSRPVGPEVTRRLTCDAAVAALPVTPAGEVGPERQEPRGPRAAMRRRIEARDQRCAFPGCPVRARRCHLHHLHHWSLGGPTVDDNLVAVCSRHHHAVHEGGWTLTGPPTDLRWTDRFGAAYAARPAAAALPPVPDVALTV